MWGCQPPQSSSCSGHSTSGCPWALLSSQRGSQLACKLNCLACRRITTDPVPSPSCCCCTQQRIYCMFHPRLCSLVFFHQCRFLKNSRWKKFRDRNQISQRQYNICIKKVYQRILLMGSLCRYFGKFPRSIVNLVNQFQILK